MTTTAAVIPPAAGDDATTNMLCMYATPCCAHKGRVGRGVGVGQHLRFQLHALRIVRGLAEKLLQQSVVSCHPITTTTRGACQEIDDKNTTAAESGAHSAPRQEGADSISRRFYKPTASTRVSKRSFSDVDRENVVLAESSNTRFYDMMKKPAFHRSIEKMMFWGWNRPLVCPLSRSLLSRDRPRKRCFGLVPSTGFVSHDLTYYQPTHIGYTASSLIWQYSAMRARTTPQVEW